jgi:hypothetical protein
MLIRVQHPILFTTHPMLTAHKTFGDICTCIMSTYACTEAGSKFILLVLQESVEMVTLF